MVKDLLSAGAKTDIQNNVSLGGWRRNVSQYCVCEVYVCDVKSSMLWNVDCLVIFLTVAVYLISNPPF